MVALPKTSDLYVIALGSNIRHARHGGPAHVLRAAVSELAAAGLAVQAVAPVIRSAPLGPSLRLYANSAVLVHADLAPPAMLGLLKSIERQFGRRGGKRWGSRVLDLDIVLWSGGKWRSAGHKAPLCIPHAAFRQRDFVLRPVAALVPHWRDPLTGFSIKQLHSRLTRSLHAPRGPRPEA